MLDRAGLIGYAVHMRTIQFAEAKANFSSIVEDVKAGDEVGIAYGKKEETVAVLIPYEKWKKGQERRLGTLQGKAEVIFADDFSMSDEELINS